MKILVTGFEPFMGHQINPSQKLSIELAEEFLVVNSLILPVEFGRAFLVLNEHLKTNAYDCILMLGQAAGRAKVSLEKIALNWMQTNNKDEAGVKSKNGEIIQNSPLALMTQFAVDELDEYLQLTDSPVHISFSAGTYVCNDLYYRMLYSHKSIKSLFIHVPLLPEQLRENMSLCLDYEVQKKVLRKIINYILKML